MLWSKMPSPDDLPDELRTFAFLTMCAHRVILIVDTVRRWATTNKCPTKGGPTESVCKPPSPASEERHHRRHKTSKGKSSRNRNNPHRR